MKKILLYFKLLAIMFCFFIIYNKIDLYYGKFVLILTLLPIAMIPKKINTVTCIVLYSFAIIMSFITFKFSFQTLITSLIIVSTIPVLSIFSIKQTIKYPNLKKRNNELLFYKEELLNEEKSLIEKKEALEKKLERITHFYIISKDLTKNIDKPEDIASALFNVLTTRAGTCYVVITTKNSSEVLKDNKTFKILSRLDNAKKDEWTKLINNNQEINNLKGASIIHSLFNIEKKPVIVWPMVIDGILNSCIFLVVEPEYTQTYIEEGNFFIPHLRLGTRRIMLFSELKEKARTDGLTELYLKRYFIEKLYSEIDRVKRYNTDFHIMMLDIDHFKKINDTYGHLIGDEVLKETSKTILSCIRLGDLVGRYGGEEFIVLLPTITQTNVIELAENIRKSIKNIVFNNNTKPFSITISIGIAKYHKGMDIDTIIGNSDNALYQAKNSGRDNIVYFENKDN